MTHAEAYVERKKIIDGVNRELNGTPYSVELDRPLDPRQWKNRGIGRGMGYLKIRNGDGETWASFDSVERNGHVEWNVGNVIFDSKWDTTSMAHVLVGRYVLESFHPTIRDRINFALLYRIKSENHGAVECFDDTEEMIAKIHEAVPLSDSEKAELRELIEGWT